MRIPFRPLVFLLLSALCLPLAAQVEWSKDGYAETLARAAKTKSVVLLDFFTTWCGPCKMLDTMTWSKPEVGTFLREHRVLALKLDAEREGRNQARTFAVRAYPTVVVVNAGGEEIGRFSGARPSDAVLAFLRQALKDPRTLPQLQAAHRKDPKDLDLTLLLARRIMQTLRGPGTGQTIRKLYDSVLLQDPDNAKGFGAQALSDRVAYGLSQDAGAFLYRLRSLERMAPPQGAFPDLYRAGSDSGASRFRSRFLEDIRGWGAQVAASCAEQLDSAREAVSAMRAVNVDPQSLADVSWTVTDGTHFPNRTLADAYYLFLAAATKDPGAQNECAWYFYVSQSHLDLAERLARESRAARPSPETVDTLAHVLFAQGKTEEALRLERKLLTEAGASGDARRQAAYRKVLESWNRGVADQTLPPAQASSPAQDKEP